MKSVVDKNSKKKCKGQKVIRFTKTGVDPRDTEKLLSYDGGVFDLFDIYRAEPVDSRMSRTGYDSIFVNRNFRSISYLTENVLGAFIDSIVDIVISRIGVKLKEGVVDEN